MSDGHSPSLDDINAIAKAALKTLPVELGCHVVDVVIRIAEFPDADIERKMGLQCPYDLLGLYQGVSLDRKSVAFADQDVDMIFLYRGPILQYCADTGEDFRHVVRHVLIHEVGHHFGLSDADMDRIERQH
ncbi:MAG TPA: metallopeptidase family protein [Rhodospirillales bacterium]|jgi:predicted Zn-dependent protease with MMP-like domain|nr:metallopeptidase family protein [Rhodospirillales bacterium]